MSRVATNVVATVRQDQAGLPTGVNPGEVKVDGLSQLEIEEIYEDRDRGGHRLLARGHWWFYRDVDAGVRVYSNIDGTRKKAWIGFLNIAVIDHFTHALLTNFLVAANKNESQLYPDAFARAANNLGGATPLLVAADRGYGFANVYQFNSESGVGTVVPYRRRSKHEPLKRYPTKLFDRLGRPWCKHCGSSSDFVRYAAATTDKRESGRQHGFGLPVERRPSLTATASIPSSVRLPVGIFCRYGATKTPTWRCATPTSATSTSTATCASNMGWRRIAWRSDPSASASPGSNCAPVPPCSSSGSASTSAPTSDGARARSPRLVRAPAAGWWNTSAVRPGATATPPTPASPRVRPKPAAA